MSVIVYGDFTDPLSRIASLRTDALRRAGSAVDWRAVAGHRSTQVVSRPLDEDTRRRIAETEQWWRDTALPGEATATSNTHVVPSPGPPVSAYAEAVVAGVADHVRALLFRSHWVHNQDIGNPDVLRGLLAIPILHGRSPAEVHTESGYAVAISGGPLTTDGWRLIGQWRGEWRELGRPELPVVRDGGSTLVGREAVAHLGALISEAGASLPPALPAVNPHPLPPLPVAAQRHGLARPGRRAAWWER